MRCGTAVVTSNESALPEIAGGAALLVDPKRADDIAGAMRAVFSDEGLRAALGQRGLERGARFDRDRMALETLSVYRRAIAET